MKKLTIIAALLLSGCSNTVSPNRFSALDRQEAPSHDILQKVDRFSERQHDPNPYASASIEVIDRGGYLYREHCAGCHGKNGEGKYVGQLDASGVHINPPIDQPSVRSADGERLFRLISHGDLIFGMPPTYLSDDDMWKLVAFIRLGQFVSGRAQ